MTHFTISKSVNITSAKELNFDVKIQGNKDKTKFDKKHKLVCVVRRTMVHLYYTNMSGK